MRCRSRCVQQRSARRAEGLSAWLAKLVVLCVVASTGGALAGAPEVRPGAWAPILEGARPAMPERTVTYHVSTTGDDRAAGTADAPWRTINHAVNFLKLGPGDQIVVRPGVYTEQVWINRGGAPTGHVTLRSEVPGKAHVRPPPSAYSTVHIRAHYVVVDGFDIVGGAGHAVDAEHVHHTQVLNNTVHDSGGSGIGYAWCEFITIVGNTAFRNAATNGYHTSGISVYQSRNITGDRDTAGFRTVIAYNVSYANLEKETPGQHTDGNGIIVDDFQSTQNRSFPSYTYPTLVENNLVFHNGGKGIQVTWSDNVTIRNNTAYHNNQDLKNTGTWRGELSNAQSSNNVWVNNIAVANVTIHPDNRAVDDTSYGGYRNTGVVWDSNLTFNGRQGEASVRTDGGNGGPSARSGNMLGVDPRLADPDKFDFRPRPDSPVLDAGSARHSLAARDLTGRARVAGDGVDLGAYEVGSAVEGSPRP